MENVKDKKVKNVRLEVRVHDDMYKRIKLEALKEKMTVSEFTRQLFELYFN